ncbi:MAG: hypothetical protein KJZ79_08285 [Bryobacteraceae bacterium]|nr:hypothetical protein [Bryobacteraceae bacterium]
MGQRIDQLVARVEDPANPVVWLDPSTSAELWAALPAALKERAFSVVVLDGVADAASLRAELLGVLGALGPIREALAALPAADGEQGWVLLYQAPEQLRELDEAAFEDLLETVAQIHEIHWSERRTHLKLVVRD